MKTLILILIPMISFGQIKTTDGEINLNELEVYMVDFNEKKDAHTVAIDIGSNVFPRILDDNGKELYVQSPLQLKIFLRSKGYEYSGSEMYVTRIPDENIFTVRYFKKKNDE